MKRFLALLLSVLLLAPALGCLPLTTNTIVGSGDIVSQTFDVNDFERVSLEGSGSVFIEQGQTESLSVQTDDNIMSLLDIRVQGDELILGVKRGYNVTPSQSITFNLTVKDLSAVALDGSGTIDVEPVNSNNLDVSIQGSGDINIRGVTADILSVEMDGSGNITIDDVSVTSVDTSLKGSGDINLEGTADTQRVRIDGSGNYLADDLETSSADISISGSAQVTVWARDELRTRVDGSGDIRYYGQPVIDQGGSGSGEIIALGEK